MEFAALEGPPGWFTIREMLQYTFGKSGAHLVSEWRENTHHITVVGRWCGFTCLLHASLQCQKLLPILFDATLPRMDDDNSVFGRPELPDASATLTNKTQLAFTVPRMGCSSSTI